MKLFWRYFCLFSIISLVYFFKILNGQKKSTATHNSTLLSNQLSTKKAYPVSQINLSNAFFLSKIEQAANIIALFRHGSRYPTKKKTAIFQNDSDFFQFYAESDGYSKKAGKLTTLGKMELFRHGQNYRSFFDSKIKLNSSDSFEFRSTHKNRTIDSMNHFLRGAFEQPDFLKKLKTAQIIIEPEPVENDYLSEKYFLRNLQRCCTSGYSMKDRRNEFLKFHFETQFGIQNFEKYRYQRLFCAMKYLETAENFTYTIEDFSDTHPVFRSICAKNITNNWPENIEKVNNYKTFYSSGPKFQTNYKTAFILLEKIIQKIKNKSNQNAFYFGHAETIVPLLTLMNIENLQHIPLEQWDVSNISPMAASFSIIIGKNDDICMFLNERNLGECKSKDNFLRYLENILFENQINDETKASIIEQCSCK